MKYRIATSHTISVDHIATINTARREVFGDDFSGDFQITPTPTNDRIFLLVDHDDNLKAFGTLQAVQITIQATNYLIRGIGNIIAIERNMGYGKYLMESMRAYLGDTKQVGIGFCEPHLAKFYRTCGYTVTADHTARFRHQKDTLESTTHVLWFDPVGYFGNHMRQTQGLISVDHPFW